MTHDKASKLEEWTRKTLVLSSGGAAIERQLVRWFTRGCPLLSGAAALARDAREGAPRDTGRTSATLRQLLVHAVLIGVLHRDGALFGALLFEPASLASTFVPTMPDDELMAILGTQSGVAWYRCPNGHPYAIGNCTRPWVEVSNDVSHKDLVS